MFYSQFILAKKGPLGTIWIAAHLERKLRKNQVADTDIGVSVDSILFPDAPIALRLSSHLLLGVVRIYSKKVNYLFNDCSEALIKIKHAFRSAAVDLPPEESTAPYNSITLPENFDLDNFELPDSACLDSNFVDHHVSTREQITLQDTLNDTAYPTSKFGLDERFGDEDASQIGLNLDEDLFMEKKISPQHDESSASLKGMLHHGETSVPSTSMAMDVQTEYDEGKDGEIPNDLSELLSNNYGKNCMLDEDLRKDGNSSFRQGYTIQTPDLNEIFQPESHKGLSPHIPFIQTEIQTSCLAGPAEVPSTPGLLETVPSNYQATGLSPQEKGETHVESFKGIKGTTLVGTKLDHKSEESAQVEPPNSVLINLMQESLTKTYSNLTTNDACFASGPKYQLKGLTGNGVSNILAADRRFDKEEGIAPSYFSHEVVNTGFSHEAINSTFPSMTTRLNEVITTNTCTDEPVTFTTCMNNMNALENTSDEKRIQKENSNESNRVENGGSSATTFAFGSDILPGYFGSNLHPGILQGDPSCFSHEAANHISSHELTSHFNKPVTPNICTDSMGVSRGITYGKNAQNNDGNKPYQTANINHVEIGNSCVSSSAVGSDTFSRSYGSSVHLISSHSEHIVRPHEVISSASHNQATHCDAESIVSIVSSDSMGVLGRLSDVRAPKNNSDPSQSVNLGLTDDRNTCINTSIESDFILKPCASNLRQSFSNDTPLFSHEAVKLASLPNYSTAEYATELVTSNSCNDVSGSILNVKIAQKNDGAMAAQLANPCHIEDSDSCINVTSTAGSSFPSISNVSNLYASSTHLTDNAMGEALKLPFTDHSGNLKTPLREEAVQKFKTSYEIQGEDIRSTNDRVISLEDQNDINYGGNKLDDPSVGIFSSMIHSDRVNISPSSEFLGSEKMLAPTFAMETPNYQGLHATDKGMADSDASVNRNSSFSGRKRRMMDSPGILETARSSKLSGASRGRNTEYTFTDDDMLASILGRTTPSIETGSVPLVSKASSQKRPRTIHKAGLSKRKRVLVDESMVLHADAIRQQLINTEDIRRKRKKAPCTRPEVWRICIGAMEDDLFNHAILTGLTVEFNNLSDLKYDLQLSSQTKDNSSRAKTSSREIGTSVVVEFFNELGNKEMNERTSSIPLTADRNEAPSSFDTGSSRIPVFLGEAADKRVDERTPSFALIVGDRKEDMTGLTVFDMQQTHETGFQCDLHDQLEELLVQPKAAQISREQEPMICEMPNDAKEDANLIALENPIPETNKSSFFQKFEYQSINLAERSLKDDAPTTSINVSESFIQTKSVCNAVGAISNEEEKMGLLDDTVEGVQTHVLPNSGPEVLPQKMNESNIICDTLGNGDRPLTDLTCVEIDDIACVQSSATMDGNDCMQNFNLEGGLDVGSVPVDIGATHHDSNDFCSAVEDNYPGSTLQGFLNEDDENFNEAENEEPDPENNTNPLENSGWSVRTRGVARYLKTLFDEESGQGRKSIAVNHLLAGKTRKEASRMFFETLVLKTRDYIQVEQEKAFDNIQIKPRHKLLKSEF